MLYYDVNLGSLTTLVKLMDKHDCHQLVFSSSATVYGSAAVPITESTPTGGGITNAYGRTKYMIEEILRDFTRSKSQGGVCSDWSVTILRYFNPIGAHSSGQIGEDPNGIPNNLMPYVAQVAVGKREKLSVFGNDYDTPDGTGVRDYIHVEDLARGHLAAIQYMQRKDPDYYVFNLGTGRGESVLDMVGAMQKACGHEIAYTFSPRREGDIATCYADTSLAKQELGWEAQLSLEQACADLWKWQSLNPDGFANKTSN
jgi:UDP-glucose 4-epimerase